jgi:hypothetical protein
VVDTDLQTLCQIVTQKHDAASLSRAQVEALIPLATQHHVLPYLYWATASDAPPQLKERHFRAVARDMTYQHVQMHVARHLAEAGIEAIWLKGGALRLTIYPEPFLRPMGDLDLLIPYDKRLAALSTLEQAGYQLMQLTHMLHSTNDAAFADQHHHFALTSAEYPWLILELHFHLLAEVGRAHLTQADLDWFIHSATPFTFQQQTMLTLADEPHLLYLIAHIALQHGLADFELRRFLDIHLLVEEHTIDWQQLVTHALRLRWSYATERVLSITKELFGTSIPAWVFEELAHKRPADEDTHLVTARETSSGREWNQFLIKMRQRSLVENIRVARELLFPPKAYMVTRYDIPPGENLFKYYIQRWKHQITTFITYIHQGMRSILRN